MQYDSRSSPRIGEDLKKTRLLWKNLPFNMGINKSSYFYWNFLKFNQNLASFGRWIWRLGIQIKPKWRFLLAGIFSGK
ncbi:hypothetical protein L1987_60106 [Smallanthus sonchifolius]|uniref:Uncharacterized protein n=1 Tax=Smallanthus sonchifolius TaxID=185202 RepID=A0ACB9D764_9ASTR|nr:hypothetical protein L1987_60106 [Smallanthus sonchifolius]